MSDAINPKHYQQHPSGVQIIELTRHMPFSLGNAFKYVARAMHKHDSPLEDLEKAQWYLEDYNSNFRDRLPTNVNKVLWNGSLEDFHVKSDLFFEHEPQDSILRNIYNLAFNHHVYEDIRKTQFKLLQIIREAK